MPDLTYHTWSSSTTVPLISVTLMLLIHHCATDLRHSHATTDLRHTDAIWTSLTATPSSLWLFTSHPELTTECLHHRPILIGYLCPPVGPVRTDQWSQLNCTLILRSSILITLAPPPLYLEITLLSFSFILSFHPPLISFSSSITCFSLAPRLSSGHAIPIAPTSIQVFQELINRFCAFLATLLLSTATSYSASCITWLLQCYDIIRDVVSWNET